LRVDPDARRIRLELEVDTEAASVMEYFEIFILRMVMCRKSAEMLGCHFRLSINGRDVYRGGGGARVCAAFGRCGI
jgi:hypothetical protein